MFQHKVLNKKHAFFRPVPIAYIMEYDFEKQGLYFLNLRLLHAGHYCKSDNRRASL